MVAVERFPLGTTFRSLPLEKAALQIKVEEMHHIPSGAKAKG